MLPQPGEGESRVGLQILGCEALLGHDLAIFQGQHIQAAGARVHPGDADWHGFPSPPKSGSPKAWLRTSADFGRVT